MIIMIKVIFGIAIFFFFIAVLFYGIRYIFIALSKLFQDKDHPKHPNQKKFPVKPSTVNLVSHHINFYDPTLNQKIEAYGEVIKCYREHDKLWIKFQFQDNAVIKTIPIEHISGVENLKTQESNYHPNQILEYFNRFI